MAIERPVKVLAYRGKCGIPNVPIEDGDGGHIAVAYCESDAREIADALNAPDYRAMAVELGGGVEGDARRMLRD